ncbi:restriction endonuclease [Okeania sp.]|uniref:restriction endonuclease n=1 Tax=Okeania sp. TaxID=3100323 RepID=UPI002B4B5875|nr:restriction endonuclease [Okeania sp.]MEB3342581.1 restriction endonuclease [Okeania sp.]
MEHEFTKVIKNALKDTYGNKSELIYSISPILQYINLKTRAANRGSKARSSFGNLYAIYVLVEDYLQKGFDDNGKYISYEGSKYSQLLCRQRKLPFGQKLQNHALNHRLNQEFKKYFPTCDYVPVIRETSNNRYWFNENLLFCIIEEQTYNLAKIIIEIIEMYISTKTNAFEDFIKSCQPISQLTEVNPNEAVDFIVKLLQPNIDARLFEIVSYSILKYYYYKQTVFFGFDLQDIQQENLKLYKTGRTNANDGGVDFVMKSLGRFFQVTETTDFKKSFLDIDKIEKDPYISLSLRKVRINYLKKLEKIHKSNTL